MGLGIKTAIRNFLKRTLPDTFDVDPSINGLCKKLKPYLNKRNGTFIEVGGNDGYTQSNTYYFSKKLGWKGILVEELPHLCEKCQARRPESKVFGCALVAHGYGQDYVDIHDANLMSSIDGALGDHQEEHLEQGKAFIENAAIKKIKVPARTLDSVIEESGLDSFDFMSLDVEGYEHEVLKGLDIDRWGLRYILIEIRDMVVIEEALQGKYEMVEKLSFHDYLFEKKA